MRKFPPFAPFAPVSCAVSTHPATSGRRPGMRTQWQRHAPAVARWACSLLAPPWPRCCLVCGELCGQSCAGKSTAAVSAAGSSTGLVGPMRLPGLHSGTTTESPDLCPACLGGLPWLRAACARCARPLPAPAPACGLCLRRPPPQASTVAAFLYEAPLDRLLPRLKFHQDLAAGRSLALAMAPAFAAALADAPPPEALPPEALVPLPLHRSRLRSRGFDQTLELARPLARALDLPLRADLLRRQRATAPQSRLDAAARRRNLRDAFSVDPPRLGRVLPAHVVLFDDVMTTGATVQSAAQALLRAGVKRVDVWVCARVG